VNEVPVAALAAAINKARSLTVSHQFGNLRRHGRRRFRGVAWRPRSPVRGERRWFQNPREPRLRCNRLL